MSDNNIISNEMEPSQNIYGFYDVQIIKHEPFYNLNDLNKYIEENNIETEAHIFSEGRQGDPTRIIDHLGITYSAVNSLIFELLRECEDQPVFRSEDSIYIANDIYLPPQEICSLEKVAFYGDVHFGEYY